MDEFGLLINRSERVARDGRYFVSLDPATGAPVGQFASASGADVEAAVCAARAAFDGDWREFSAANRG